VTLHDKGKFVVSDDDDDVMSTAINLATAPQKMGRVPVALSPTGEGFSIDTIGAMYRVEHRDDLFSPFGEDPSIDPATQELWMLVRDREKRHRIQGHVLMSGDELRDLVQDAIDARANRR